MKHPPFLFLLLLSYQAAGSDLPLDFITTKDEMYLNGQPKIVQYKSQDNEIGYYFTENGILVKRLSKDERFPSMMVDFKRGKLNQIIEFTGYSHKKRDDSGTFYEPLKFDGKDRITAINKTSRSRGPRKLVSPHGVTIITYEQSKQIHETYINRLLASTKIFELSPDGKITKSSETTLRTLVPVIQPDKVVEYGEYGPLKMWFGKLETEYSYIGGILISEIKRSSTNGPVVGRKSYDHYILDDCKNWVYREAHDKSPSFGSELNAPFIEERVIEYYSECN